jgi:hypothetical protein
LLPGTAPAAGAPRSVRHVATNVNAHARLQQFHPGRGLQITILPNSFAINPPVDAIREFEILTGSYDASSGRTAGAQVNIVTKAGTNEIHGTAYEFIRNAALDARNFFARAGDAAPRYQRNQFGFSLGSDTKEPDIFRRLRGRRMRKDHAGDQRPDCTREDWDFSQSIYAAPLDPFTQSVWPPHSTMGARSERPSPCTPPQPAVPGQNYAHGLARQ